MKIAARVDYAPSALPPALTEKIVSAYRAAGERHRGAMSSGWQWGFKNPRQMFLLPVLRLAFPSARFVHLVRDGRDMLLSDNTTQARKHFRSLFGFPFDQSIQHIAHFWAKTNLEANIYGTEAFGSGYTVVRIEDLCGTDRGEHIAKLAQALGLDPVDAGRHADTFRTLDSIGRGHAAADDLPPAIRVEFFSALAKFGYI
jgi:hypothetical protein